VWRALKADGRTIKEGINSTVIVDNCSLTVVDIFNYIVSLGLWKIESPLMGMK
jgi:hypothetical protein